MSIAAGNRRAARLAARPEPGPGLGPPRLPRCLVDRPGLVGFLAAAMNHRVTVLRAGPGLGKTTLLAQWYRTLPAATWYRADALAGLGGIAADALAAGQPFVLVVDDVSALDPAGPPARLLATLIRDLPPDVHLVLAARDDPPLPLHRLRGQGRVLDVPACALAFNQDETAALTAGLLGPDGVAPVAGPVHELTQGWPALVRMVLDQLANCPPAQWPAKVEHARLGPVGGYLADLLAGYPEATRRLLRAAARLPVCDAELCRALGLTATERDLVELATRDRVFVERPEAPGWYTAVPLVREVLAGTDPLAGGHLASVAAALRTHGQRLLAGGFATEVIAAVDGLPGELRDAGLDLLAGEAHQVSGDFAGALRCFRLAAAGDRPPPEAAVAWRVGMSCYLQGEYRRAIEVFDACPGGAEDTADEAILLAASASAHWLTSDFDTSRKQADRALAAARRCADARALGHANAVLAMLAHQDGDHASSECYGARALIAAEQAADVLLAIRAGSNRASHRCDRGQFADAMADLDAAVRLAERAGHLGLLGLVRHNRGEVRLWRGELDLALADFGAARSAFTRIGSAKLVHPLVGSATVHRERGAVAEAATGYAEALACAERLGDRQALVPALLGMATVASGTDRHQARHLIGRASRVASDLAGPAGPVRPDIDVTLGWLELADGSPGLAAELAESARAGAAGHGNRSGVAEATELLAMAADDPARRHELLAEAAATWTGLGSRVRLARVRLAVARLDGQPDQIEQAAGELRALGVAEPPAGMIGLLAAVAGPPVAVRLRTLGGFQLYRDGRPVPAQEWHSRKARDLLTLLVARRGRPVSRQRAADALWPDQDPVRCGNRLSVALSAIRNVLDPQRRCAQDTFVTTHQDTIGLANLRVDVEEFLDLAERALQAAGTGAADAVELLTRAEALYTGDFVADDPAAEWTGPLREEASSGYVAVLRALGAAAAVAGATHRAIRCCLRLLEHDRYDEAAHLDLVRLLVGSGQLGEARRRYRVYAARMAELDVPAAPFPGNRGVGWRCSAGYE